jgi:hypothetical protein
MKRSTMSKMLALSSLSQEGVALFVQHLKRIQETCLAQTAERPTSSLPQTSEQVTAATPAQIVTKAGGRDG